MAAPIFAGSAANIDITSPIPIEGIPHNLARLRISPDSKLNGILISNVEKTYEVSVVMVNQKGNLDFHPSGDIKLNENDTIAIIGVPENISGIVQTNNC
jgi:Trk K+ transport system NAD-binding subunit